LRTNQYAFVLVLQIVLLTVTFSLEAKMFQDWRLDAAASNSSQIQPLTGDQGSDGLLGFLMR
jgi:hypothetical protein